MFQGNQHTQKQNAQRADQNAAGRDQETQPDALAVEGDGLSADGGGKRFADLQALPPLQRTRALLQLQRRHGNAYVQRMMAAEAAVRRAYDDEPCSCGGTCAACKAKAEEAETDGQPPIQRSLASSLRPVMDEVQTPVMADMLGPDMLGDMATMNSGMSSDNAADADKPSNSTQDAPDAVPDPNPQQDTQPATNATNDAAVTTNTDDAPTGGPTQDSALNTTTSHDTSTTDTSTTDDAPTDGPATDANVPDLDAAGDQEKDALTDEANRDDGAPQSDANEVEQADADVVATDAKREQDTTQSQADSGKQDLQQDATTSSDKIGAETEAIAQQFFQEPHLQDDSVIQRSVVQRNFVADWASRGWGWLSSNVVQPISNAATAGWNAVKQSGSDMWQAFKQTEFKWADLLMPSYFMFRMQRNQRKIAFDRNLAIQEAEQAKAVAEGRMTQAEADKPTFLEKVEQADQSIFSVGESIMDVPNQIVEGAVLGDFKENPSIWNTIGQVAIGFVPYAGQVADIRDATAAIIKLQKSGWKDPWEWFNLGLTVVGFIPGVGDAIKAVGKGSKGFIKKGVGFLAKHGGEIWNGIRKNIGPLMEGASKFGRNLLDQAGRIGRGMLDSAKNMGRSLLTSFSKGMAKAKGMLSSITNRVSGIGNRIKSVASGALGKAQGFLSKIGGRIVSGVSSAMSKARAVASKAADLVKSTFAKGKALFNRLKQGAVQKFNQAKTWAQETIQAGIAKGKALLTKAKTFAKQKYDQAVQGAKTLAKKAYTKTHDFVVGGMKRLKEGALRVGREYISPMKNAIQDWMGKKWQQVKEKLGFKGGGDVPPAKGDVPSSGAVPDPKKPKSPELEASGKKQSGLSPAEVDAELDAVRKGKRTPINDGDYVEMVDVGNGHVYKKHKDGHWCRFSDVPKDCFPAGPDGLPTTVDKMAAAKGGQPKVDANPIVSEKTVGNTTTSKRAVGDKTGSLDFEDTLPKNVKIDDLDDATKAALKAEYQKLGIDDAVNDFKAMLGKGEKLSVTTVTKVDPKTGRLTSIEYKVEVHKGRRKKPVRHYSAEVGVGNGSATLNKRTGRVISETTQGDQTVIKSMVGDTPGRLDLENTLPSDTKYSSKGWQRAHSQGNITGAESGKGVLYAPEEVNQAYQRLGIEGFINDLNHVKADDVEIFLTTVTKKHPGTSALAEIEYVVLAKKAGDARPTMLFETSIEVAKKGDNPKVIIAGETFNGDLGMAVEPFLKPLP